MNKQLSEYLEKLNNGADFIVEQAPETVQQLVTYAQISSIVYMVVGILLMIALSLVCLFCYKKYDETTEECYIGMFIIFALCNGITLLVFIVQLDEVIKIWFSPKWYILEQFVSLLVKKSG